MSEVALCKVENVWFIICMMTSSLVDWKEKEYFQKLNFFSPGNGTNDNNE